MTKRDAQKFAKWLDRTTGWERAEIIKYESFWRVYATATATGYRKHWDQLPESED